MRGLSKQEKENFYDLVKDLYMEDPKRIDSKSKELVLQ